jgi:YHS domain-containing protein
VEVSDHIRNMVKHKTAKNGFKHYFSNSATSDKFKDSLKRIPRRTNKMDMTIMDNPRMSLKQSIYKNSDDTIVQTERIDSTLVKIYHYLRN